MKRITVVGTPGSGKTTLAQHLARRLHYPFVELDALFWGPNWTPAPTELFRERVAAALADDCWTLGGNYSVARDLVSLRSDTVVWLDYGLPLVLWRLVPRTVKRIVTQEELWASNRETWRAQLFSRDSLLLFALQTHARRKHTFAHELAQPAYRHLHSLRFSHPRETQRWLEQQSLPIIEQTPQANTLVGARENVAS